MSCFNAVSISSEGSHVKQLWAWHSSEKQHTKAEAYGPCPFRANGETFSAHLFPPRLCQDSFYFCTTSITAQANTDSTLVHLNIEIRETSVSTSFAVWAVEEARPYSAMYPAFFCSRLLHHFTPRGAKWLMRSAAKRIIDFKWCPLCNLVGLRRPSYAGGQRAFPYFSKGKEHIKSRLEYWSPTYCPPDEESEQAYVTAHLTTRPRSVWCI